MIATPSLAQRAHDRRTGGVDLGLGQRRGRLVHDDEARLDRERAGDLDHLLLGHRKVGDRRVGIDVEADAGE